MILLSLTSMSCFSLASASSDSWCFSAETKMFEGTDAADSIATCRNGVNNYQLHHCKCRFPQWVRHLQAPRQNFFDNGFQTIRTGEHAFDGGFQIFRAIRVAINCLHPGVDEAAYDLAQWMKQMIESRAPDDFVEAPTGKMRFCGEILNVKSKWK